MFLEVLSRGIVGACKSSISNHVYRQFSTQRNVPAKLFPNSIKFNRTAVANLRFERCHSHGLNRWRSTNAAPETSGTDFGADAGRGGMGTYQSDPEAEAEFQVKLKILGAALNHVNTRGWSLDALKAGAEDLNLSESVASLCTPFDLVEYFQRLSNSRLESHLTEVDSKEKSLYSSMEYRLRLVVPVIDRYHQAMGLSLEPVNVPRSLSVLRELADIICINGLGDKSTDLRWYTKRTGIVSLYVATECYMVQDKSEDFKETWDFLERRTKDYESFEKAGSMLMPAVETGVTTMLNILGLNRKR